MKLITESDLPAEARKAHRIAIIGYGSQGRAHALNLRDSGHEVLLGLRPGGASDAKAKADGFSPITPAEAAQAGDIIALLIPDMAQAQTYGEAIAPAMGSGKVLMFAHGFAIHYGLIQPPADCDIALIAPKAPGDLVRREFQAGRGTPCLMAIHQDASGTARTKALAYGAGLGGARAGILETSFAEETETDLFGEQAVLCGGMTELVLKGFETLTEAGYQPELAYFECLHELKLIVDLLQEGGLAKMHQFISETAKWGDLTAGPRLIDDSTKQRMQAILEDIRSGAFARDWIAENQAGLPRYREKLAADLAHPIEATGARLRARMAWLAEQSMPKAAE